MLDVQRLACVRGDRALFRHLEFCLPAGHLLRVTGRNGSGKTSLLRILCGLSQPDAGTVLWHGQVIAEQRDVFHGRLLYLGHSPALNDLLTPVENLRFACQASGDDFTHGDCIDSLKHIGLDRELELPCKVLSQGQRRRVALARVFLAAHRPLWLLDEPFTALDKHAIGELASTLDAHCARNGSVVITTHQEVAFAARQESLSMEAFAA
ncbi:MAG TPA: cytochrome c biogenesis heme-transporting ATPase CcmA [Rhodocyclaceae bacterium]|nr:cytochrome c biogenesis heme-transporting ATPase CcmA [Rhodocyclaceae bacterium]